MVAFPLICQALKREEAMGCWRSAALCCAAWRPRGAQVTDGRAMTQIKFMPLTSSAETINQNTHFDSE
jgi:hypothetical protein